MKNIYIYCEGQTEESFINEVLSPYLSQVDIWVYPIICTTKRTNLEKFRGGVSEYSKIKKELTMLCKSHKNEIITNMFDYYAMPSDTPLIGCSDIDIYSRIEKIENDINIDIGEPNCHFNFLMHEFEGLLFSKPNSFKLVADDKVVNEIVRIKSEAISPEHINNSPETAPSKRLEALMPGYAKVKNGTIISKDIGMDVIMSNCKHFAHWIEEIKSFR